MNKKLIALITVVIFSISITASTLAATDREVLFEDVEKIYDANSKGKDIINNISFSDVSDTHWANEAITRLGALEIVKGYNEGNKKAYRPGNSVSNQEVLAFILRALGLEEDAQLAAAQIEQDPENPEHILTLWSKGYLQVANQVGLIDQDELDAALSEDQEGLDPIENFIREAPTTREQVAEWLVIALNNQKPDLIEPLYTQQAVFDYSDWEQISNDKIPFVEAVIQKQIMVGDGIRFNPTNHITRAEMAQILKNVDEILYEAMNITRKNGVVAHIQDSNEMGAGGSTSKRTILIRTEDGKVNEINYIYDKTAIDKIFTKDVPVYMNGTVGGMLTLREGDYIEYLTNNDTNEMLYIYSKGIGTPYELEGILQPLTKLQEGKVTVKSDDGIYFTYQIIDGLYDTSNNTIKIEDITISLDNAPVNSQVKLTLQNNIVTYIKYGANNILYDEINGIVKENNPVFGYITIIDWDGNEITKYYKKSVTVEKQQYYDVEDEIGYIDEIFPDYRFDPRNATIEDIEAGDIIHIRLDPSDNQYISSISAKTNYVVKYGIVKDVVNNGVEGLRILIEHEDLTTTLYEVSSDTPIIKSGNKVTSATLVEGDWIKMLVNQAVLQPGTVSETIKEIIIDEYGNVITNLYRGELGTVNDSQRTMTLLNSFELTKTGWQDYEQAKILDISNNNIEFYEDEEWVSLDYARKYLRQEGLEVYVAMEKHYNDEQVVKITFRDGRDSVSPYDNVTYSNGNGKFKTLQKNSFIETDEGTIVVRNGKLVEEDNIVSSDYVQVIMNGNNKAAVVNIIPEPGNEALSIFRGRIQKIDYNKSFQVQSHAVLKEMEWIYSPIPRLFTLDYDTVIIDSNGIVPQDSFIDYSEVSNIDEVQTIIANGTKALYIVNNPYSEEGVKGEIYDIDTETIKIKDTIVYDTSDTTWKDLSYTNSYSDINILTNSTIIKNNKVISSNELEKGDRIRVLTTEFLIDKLKLNGLRDVDGYIILVEK